jgi:hypothetical protein
MTCPRDCLATALVKADLKGDKLHDRTLSRIYQCCAKTNGSEYPR